MTLDFGHDQNLKANEWTARSQNFITDRICWINIKVLYKFNARFKFAKNQNKQKNQLQNMTKVILLCLCFGIAKSSWINLGLSAGTRLKTEQSAVQGGLSTLQKSVDHFIDIDRSRFVFNIFVRHYCTHSLWFMNYELL